MCKTVADFIRSIVFHSLERLTVPPNRFFKQLLARLPSLLVPESQYLNAFCLLSLNKEAFHRNHSSGVCQKNLFLINITRKGISVETELGNALGHNSTNCSRSLSARSGDREEEGWTRAVCQLQESSDGRVTGSDLLLKSCGGFQGEQRNKCLYREVLFNDG